MKFFLLLFFLSSATSSLQAFVKMKSASGEDVHWNSGVTSLDLYVDLENRPSSGSDNDWLTEISSAAAQWNNISKINTLNVYSDAVVATTKNSIRFENLGSGTLGLTAVAYRSATGEIVNASISITTAPASAFDLDPDGDNYIGDVIAHEIGHLLGLGHSQTHFSSMLYEHYRGQYLVKSDDRLGMQTLYPTGASALLGKISGRVAGGTTAAPIGIFGAYVEAVSAESGKSIVGVVTNSNGQFEIGSLPAGAYYLRTSPLGNISSLSKYYSSVRSDFCTSRSSYEPSFYRQCGETEKGFPSRIALTNGSNISVGTVSIGCSEEASADLLQDTILSSVEKVVATPTAAGLGVVGYFTSSDISVNEENEFRLDLSPLTVTGNQTYLEIILSSQSLYSPFIGKLDVDGTTYFQSENETDDMGEPTDSNGLPDYTIVVRKPLSETSASNHVVVKVMAEDPLDHLNHFPSLSSAKRRIYPSYSDFLSSENFYLLTARVVRSTDGGGTVSSELFSSGSTSFVGNSACIDGPLAYSTTPSISSGESTSSQIKSKSPLAACGTIGSDSDQGGGGKGSVLLTIFIGYFLMQIFGKRKSTILLK